jgi:hypothetical protein
MSILTYVTGLSMGNTCQLPVLTHEANGCVRRNGEMSQKRPGLSPFLAAIGSFPRFFPVLHNPPLVSTGCAQRGNGFELRCKRVRVQSLITQ